MVGIGLGPNGFIALGSQSRSRSVPVIVAVPHSPRPPVTSRSSFPPSRNAVVLVLPRRHPHVPPEREQCEHVFRFTPSAAPERRPKPDGKTRRVDAERLGREEMSQLVDEDHESKDEDWCEPDQHENNLRTCRRASASTASSASRLPLAVSPNVSSAESSRSRYRRT